MTDSEIPLKNFSRNFPRGTILFQDGDLSREMYVIHSGRVRIQKQMGDVSKTLAILGPGDFLGEMATLLDKPRSATAEVVEDSVLIVIEPHTFEVMITGNAKIALKIMRKLAGRIAEANEKIENLMIGNNMNRLVHIIARKAETDGVKEGNHVRIDITPKELAHDADLDIHVTRDLIEKLSQINVLKVDEQAIRVSGIHKLKFLDFLALKKGSGKV